VAETRRGKGVNAGQTAAATGQAARAAAGSRAGARPSSAAGGSRAGASSSSAEAGTSAAWGRQSEDAQAPGSHGPEHDGVCPVAFCPICTAVSAVNRASPDVLQHLLLAGQQFLMALKAVVDARAADFEEHDGDEPTIERIDIG
jgi:hypothetical protein